MSIRYLIGRSDWHARGLSWLVRLSGLLVSSEHFILWRQHCFIVSTETSCFVGRLVSGGEWLWDDDASVIFNLVWIQTWNEIVIIAFLLHAELTLMVEAVVHCVVLWTHDSLVCWSWRHVVMLSWSCNCFI